MAKYTIIFKFLGVCFPIEVEALGPHEAEIKARVEFSKLMLERSKIIGTYKR